MVRKVKARVRAGRLEPLEMIDPPEGKEVTVTIEDVSPDLDREAFLRSAGGWKGRVDTDALIKMLYAARLRPGRQPAS